MKKLVLSLVLAVCFLMANSQDLLKIEGQNVSLDEFKSIFYKNNHNDEITKDYLDEYMNLFVNFKLKVREAKEMGLDTNLSFINELEGYRKQLAKPYLKNKEFDNNILLEAYERISLDVNASHILLSVDENATEKIQQEVYAKALNIRRTIIDGEISFSESAKKISDDKSALTNGGNLGYFTAFMMVYNFETAAYNTKIGEISMPIKTKYGYHLIKVNDRRKASGKVKVAHIMFKTGEGADKNKIEDAFKKISEVKELLDKGDDFESVAERFSEDRSTAVKGGVLPIFGVGKMLPKFEYEAFSLNNVGDISSPFLTNYGYHIIKLIEKQPIDEFDIISSDLKRMISRDSRSELSQNALFEKLRKSYNIKNNVNEFISFRKLYAIKVSNGNFVSKEINKSTLFNINNFSVSVDDFAQYILMNQNKGSDIDEMYVNFVNSQLLLFEESRLEENHPEYKALLKEYKEGILLFDLTNEKVWTKAVEDTVGLRSYFVKNQMQYTWPNRLDATIYTCASREIAKEVKKKIYQKNWGKITNEEMLEQINSDVALNLQIQSNIFTHGENNNIDIIEWKKGISNDIVLDDGSYVLVDINKVMKSRNKEINETRGKVISDYQNVLESEWISALKSKYSVIINREILYSLIK